MVVMTAPVMKSGFETEGADVGDVCDVLTLGHGGVVWVSVSLPGAEQASSMPSHINAEMRGKIQAESHHRSNLDHCTMLAVES